MLNAQEQFRKNQALWTDNDKQIAEQFFLSNAFFSRFYQNKKLAQISKICRYCKLESGQKLILQNNNRAYAIVLLKGECVIKKKQIKIRKKARVSIDDKQQKLQKGNKRYENSQSNFEQQFEYTFLAHLKEFNQTLTLNSQSVIQIPQNRSAQIIFVPCALYYQLQQQIEQQRVQKIQKVLQKFFFRLKKKQIRELSQNNCCFRQFKMNNYIYRASSKPQEVYLLLQGMVKLEKPGFSQQTLKENLLLNPGMIFGDKDLKLEERTRNAVTCTAHVQVLTIPKMPFLKYAPKAFPQMVFDEEKLSPTKLPKLDEGLRLSHSVKISPTKSFLPFIKRSHFHESSLNAQSKKSESEQKRQYDLIRNSHILVDMNAKKERKFELRKFSPKTKQQMQALLKNQKLKLKQLKLQSRFSVNNSLLNL